MGRTIRCAFTVRWKASDGEPGTDAIYYKLKVMKGGSVITSIPCDSAGTPKKVENVSVYIYRVVGRNETLISDFYWHVVGLTSSGSVNETLVSGSSSASSCSFACSTKSSMSYRIRVTEGSGGSGNIIAEVILPKALDGVGISGVKEYYLISASSSGITTSTSGWSTSVQQPTSAKPYLWNYEEITYTTGNPTKTTPAVIGRWSKDGKSIVSVTEYYLVSSSKTGVTTSASGWSTSIPTMTATNKYLWNYEKITYSEGDPTNTAPVVIGVYGDKGNDGYSVIIADTTSRQFTYLQWQTYGAKGHSETWVNINNATAFKVGDTIVINGVCTDRGNIGVSLYATVTAINGTSITATTTQLLMGNQGQQGATGYPGVVHRVFENGNVVGQVYRNDVNLASTGLRYLDFQMKEDSSMESGYAVYQCVLTHTATSSTGPGNTTYWTKLSANAASAFFRFLIAQNASIKVLSNSRFLLMNGSNEVVAGMQGSNEGMPVFWAGSTEDNADKAPFRVYPDRGTYVEGHVVSGDAEGQRVELNPDDKCVYIYDANNKACTMLDGNTYTKDKVVPAASSGNVSMTLLSNAAPTSFLPSTDADKKLFPLQEKTISFSLTSAMLIESPSLVRVNYHSLRIRIQMDAYSSANNHATPLTTTNVVLAIRLYAYTDSDCTKYAFSQPVDTISMYEAPSVNAVDKYNNYSTTAKTKEVTVPGSNLYYILKAEIIGRGTNISTCNTRMSASWKVTAVTVIPDAYMSKYFANGLALTQNSENYLVALVIAKKMFMYLGGIFEHNGVQQPPIVFQGRFNYSTSSSKPVITGAYVGTIPTVTRSAEGQYMLTFNNALGLTASNMIVEVSGYGYSNGSTSYPIKATLMSLGMNTVTIHTSDDASRNDGGFCITVRKKLS